MCNETGGSYRGISDHDLMDIVRKMGAAAGRVLDRLGCGGWAGEADPREGGGSGVGMCVLRCVCVLARTSRTLGIGEPDGEIESTGSSMPEGSQGRKHMDLDCERQARCAEARGIRWLCDHGH